MNKEVSVEEAIWELTRIRVNTPNGHYELSVGEIFAPLTRSAEIQMAKVQNTIKKTLETTPCIERIDSRAKPPDSLLFKLVDKLRSVDEIHDLIGVRPVCSTEDSCYTSFKKLVQNHELCFRLMDYMSLPKNEGYRSLDFNIAIESAPAQVQMRTENMHQASLQGTQSHALRKSNKLTALQERLKNTQKRNTQEEHLNKLLKKLYDGCEQAHDIPPANYVGLLAVYSGRPFRLPELTETKYSKKIEALLHECGRYM